MDAESIYEELRETAERLGFVSDHADDLLGEAARTIASQEELP